MKYYLIIALSLLAMLLGSCSSEPQPMYEANWESLSKHEKEPEWFKDSKLGIYFHWGLYTVPAYGSAWYAHHLYQTDLDEGWGSDIYEHHVATYGSLDEFNYHDFAPMFTAEHFDAAEWAELFESAGARFAGPVAIHHDGYALWESDVNPWNVGDIGPNKDILGELFSELEKRDMKTIATFHHARTLQRYADKPDEWGGPNSHFAYNPEFVTSSKDDKLKYFYGNLEEKEGNEYWLAQVEEVVEKYSPDAIWFDSWLDEIPESYLQQMVATQFNQGVKDGKETIVVYKQEDLPRNLAINDVEQGGFEDIAPDFWMSDITLSTGGWGYTNGQRYKTLDLVVRNMIDVWSKKGVVLLNISPRSDGVINDEQRALLKGLGEWLEKYGEAVYATRGFAMFGYGDTELEEGEFGGQSASQQYTASDVRFTMSKDGKTLFVFTLGMPEANSEIVLKHIANADYPTIKDVRLVGSNEKLDWSIEGEVLSLNTPSASEMSDLATVFAVEFK